MGAAAGSARSPMFDATRALAALAIVVVHVVVLSDVLDGHWYRRLLTQLDHGVPIFFALSGYLLYRPMLAERVLHAPATSLAEFARRRVLRILPAYWVALTILAIVPGLAGVFSRNWWVYYGLLQNYPVYTPGADCVNTPLRCGIAPTWTLAIEIAFYLVLPIFAGGMRRLAARCPRTNWLALELSMLGLLSAMSVAIQGDGSFRDLHLWLFFSPLGRAWWFSVGMGLAAVSVRLEQRHRLADASRWVTIRSGVFWGTALLLYALSAWFDGPLLAFPFGTSHDRYLVAYVLAGAISLFCLLPVVFWDGRQGLSSRLVVTPVVGWLGRTSYGIFLWHYPILLGLIEGGALEWWPPMTFPLILTLTLFLTVICASLSYVLVERPLMSFRRA